MADCPHLSLVLKVNKEELVEKSEGVCHDCKKKGKLWSCLQGGCQYIGCGESEKDHSTKHYKEFKHSIAVNLVSFRIWCYACNSEVHLPSSFTPAQMKALKKSRKQGSVNHRTETSNSRSPPLKSNSRNETSRTKRPEPDPPNLAANMETDVTDSDMTFPLGLTGLRNMGNTCYMNSALQAISNCMPLTHYFWDSDEFYNVDKKPSMAKNYFKLIHDMWNPNRHPCITPTGIHMTLKSINPSFRGYHQQDAQEFLRCLMDRLHEELKYPVPLWVDQQASSAEISAAASHNELDPIDVDVVEGIDSTDSVPTPSTGNEDYDHHNIIVNHSKSSSTESFYSTMSETETRSLGSVPNVSAAAPLNHMASSYNNLTQLHGQDPAAESNPASMRRADSSWPQMNPTPQFNQREKRLSTSEGKQIKRSKRSMYRYRSIVSEIFDGELRSSVQCLTCDQVSHTRETFQDLSLPIPGKDDLTRLHGTTGYYPASGSALSPVVPGFNGPCSKTNNTQAYLMSSVWSMFEWFKSWFWGPQVTLNDCLSAFFSADELKGDNMYSCEKCKKLRNGVKYCRLLQLPEVLCVHLKRFRHEYLMSYSSKISSPVSFPIKVNVPSANDVQMSPLQMMAKCPLAKCPRCDQGTIKFNILHGLDLRPYLAQDSPSSCTNYDLCSVIVHLGNAGGGHYTTYAKNFTNQKWYEFDDQFVTEVSESIVLNAEAYVLFYSKSSVESTRAKERISNLFQEEQQKIVAIDNPTPQSLLQFYVSRKWINKFLTFTEPGPIDNSDFVCRHLDILPDHWEILDRETVQVTERVWQEMNSRYGGGPAMTSPSECKICAEEYFELEKRRSYEREMFCKLTRASRDLDSSNSVYISLDWFRDFEDFLNGKIPEPPGEVDNRPISITKEGKNYLKKNSSHAPITIQAWDFLTSIYGGGPTVSVRYRHTSSTSPTRSGKVSRATKTSPKKITKVEHTSETDKKMTEVVVPKAEVTPPENAVVQVEISKPKDDVDDVIEVETQAEVKNVKNEEENPENMEICKKISADQEC